ncbi:uncharacterized protein GLRG_01777 [Colletotrichum graminicola M1.001]|uniref:Uncharacterized protein n=1 Tax=Colletotrichum graminicola (strain M1.001 / M2 / FGSC 10212) TaxID=645133 RepID=E3Q9A3_COLGM|nr:uncharacterized protein GLRG_01777 [Colletotrichum graminicola M1.001]EFQ27282.1 hypothetical protein GLRG_01777 [Colletotrichum graminicola M1.001]
MARALDVEPTVSGNGTSYLITKLLTPDVAFNETAYQEFGPPFVGTHVLLTIFFNYAAYTSAMWARWNHILAAAFDGGFNFNMMLTFLVFGAGKIVTMPYCEYSFLLSITCLVFIYILLTFWPRAGQRGN